MTPDLASVLKLARWAPSGDNTQPWRFRILGEREVEVLYRPSERLGVFNLDHYAGRMAMGALLECIDIAASAHGWEMRLVSANAMEAGFKLCFEPVGRPPSALLPFIQTRVTQRRPLSLARLSVAEKQALEMSVGKSYSLVWIEGLAEKWRLAWLLGLTDKVRLTIPEAFRVHQETVAWGLTLSDDRIPDAAISVDPVLLRVMRWAMKSWRRVDLLNRYAWGHSLPRLEMDVVPALFCGAHCLLVAEQPVVEPEQEIEAGRAMQRLWLTATSLGLQTQPEMAPLIFSRYVVQDRMFSESAAACSSMRLLRGRFADLWGDDNWARSAFMMRLGKGGYPTARSLRIPLADLLLPS